MAEVFLGRQPIYDRNVEPVGYEILYRVSDVESAHVADADQATAEVILNTFIELDLDGVAGQHRAFFNITEHFLREHWYRSLPQGRVVLELPANAPLGEGSLEALAKATEAGYRVALDNFVPGEDCRALLRTASYAKVDVSTLEAGDIRKITELIAPYRCKAIAHRVETKSLFELCVAAGFDYFQGFFFCKPDVIAQRTLPIDRMALAKLASEVQDANVKIERVCEIVERNVSLAYRLLRLVNSSLYSFPREITSIRHAIALMGFDQIRSLVGLMLLAGVDDKPQELMVTALVRARMCGLLAEASDYHRSDIWFSAGLLSVLDAMTDMPMERVLENVRLSDELTDALMHRAGPGGRALEAAIACEEGNFDQLVASPFDRQLLNDSFLKAARWAAKVNQELKAKTKART